MGSVRDRVKKLKKQLGVKKTDDPDGVMAVLQTARRIIADEGDMAVYAVLDEAVDMAAPKDDAIAWWAAHYAILSQVPSQFRTVGDYAVRSSQEDLVALFDAAILAQGTMNINTMRDSKVKGHKNNG